MNTPQSGNVLFLILIAVALFAALSFAVTQSTRGGGDANKEQAGLKASQLVDYAGKLQAAGMRLKITGNCPPTKMSFEKSPYTDTNPFTEYPNATAPADKSCHYFHPNGGGVSPMKLNDIGAAKMVYTGSCNVANLPKHIVFGIGGGDLNYDICKSINKSLGYNAPSFEPPVMPFFCASATFTGDFTTQGMIAGINNMHAGCVEGTGGFNDNIGSGAGHYWFYSTIIPEL